MDDYRKRRFKSQYEPWALAVVCGRVSSESPLALAFLDVHFGRSQPVSEVEKLWIEYWNGKPPSASSLKDIYLKRAMATQRPAHSYAEIVHAYRLANLCGSEPARLWLREQKLAPLKTKTIWHSQEIQIWEINGMD